MTPERAKEIVNTMLHVCQKLRSNIQDPGTYGGGDLIATWFPDPEEQERVRADLYPWIFGDKSIMPTLIDLSMGLKPITGLTVYNLMTIAHRLAPEIAWIAAVRDQADRLPEPDVRWVTELR